MSVTDPVLAARSHLALASRRDRGADPARIADARRALAVAKLERDIRAAIGGDAPLTDEQRRALAYLLVSTP